MKIEKKLKRLEEAANILKGMRYELQGMAALKEAYATKCREVDELEKRLSSTSYSAHGYTTAWEYLSDKGTNTEDSRLLGSRCFTVAVARGIPLIQKPNPTHPQPLNRYPVQLLDEVYKNEE